MPKHVEPFGHGKYDGHEPVAFAIIPLDAVIDWKDGNEPDETLWIPESLFTKAIQFSRRGSLLSDLNIYQQNLLTAEETEALLRDIETVLKEISDPDVSAALRHIAELGRRQVQSFGTHFLVEGP